MSQSTDKTSCISHRQNIRFFVMYEDFLDVARVSEEHQYKLAAFWRVLETKTNDQIIYNTKLIENARTQGLPEPETTLWIEIPYSEFVNRSLGVYKSSSFQFASAESERLGFSKCRVLKRPRNPRDPNSPLEEYKEYLFLTEAMQTVLTSGVYPTPIENNSPLLKSYNERKAKRAIKNNTTPIENNTGSAIENNSPPIEINNNKYITSITDKNTEVIESSDDVAIANHHASSPTLPESGTIQGHHQGSEHSPEIVHAPSFSTDPDVKGDVSPTQDSGFLPSVQSENASVSSIPSNEPPTQSQAISASPQSEKTALSTNDTSKQASYSREHAHETPDTVTPEPEQPPSRQKPRARKPAEKPVSPAQPDLSHLSEQEQQVYAMLRAEDKPKYLAYSPAKREVYNNWLGSYGFAVSVDITPKFDECLNRAVAIHPSAEDFKNWRATLKKQDNEKLPEKRYFKNRNPQIWDVMRDIASLREMIDTAVQNPAKNTSSLKATMTKDQACKLAHDIVEQAKQYGYTVQAQAASSAKVEGAWVVHVKWEGAYVPVIKSAEQWQKKFMENHDILQFDAQFDKKVEGVR